MICFRANLYTPRFSGLLLIPAKLEPQCTVSRSRHVFFFFDLHKRARITVITFFRYMLPVSDVNVAPASEYSMITMLVFICSRKLQVGWNMVGEVHPKFHESSPVDSDFMKRDRNTASRAW
jgi:hypothetical protein